MKKRLILLPAFLYALFINAQIHLDINIENMHLWRGIEVADGLIFTTNVSISDTSKHFRIGVWGGTNTQGSYKEFNYHATYSNKGFSISLWDTYNFSPGATYNNKDFFNYKANETGRFLDAIMSYHFGDKLPLLVSWSTVIFGRDRNITNTANKYSTFCYAEYPVYCKNEWRVDVGVGGAFALNRREDSSYFYGNKAGIVHVTIKLCRILDIGNWQVPVFVCGMWNPQGDKGFLQVGAQLFSF